MLFWQNPLLFFALLWSPLFFSLCVNILSIRVMCEYIVYLRYVWTYSAFCVMFEHILYLCYGWTYFVFGLCVDIFCICVMCVHILYLHYLWTYFVFVLCVHNLHLRNKCVHIQYSPYVCEILCIWVTSIHTYSVCVKKMCTYYVFAWYACVHILYLRISVCIYCICGMCVYILYLPYVYIYCICVKCVYIFSTALNMYTYSAFAL